MGHSSRSQKTAREASYHGHLYFNLGKGRCQPTPRIDPILQKTQIEGTQAFVLYWTCLLNNLQLDIYIRWGSVIASRPFAKVALRKTSVDVFFFSFFFNQVLFPDTNLNLRQPAILFAHRDSPQSSSLITHHRRR